MRVIGYVRVSTEEQSAKGVSLETQRAKLADYAKLYGHTIVEVVADEGLSGKSLDRPGLARALGMLQDGSADGLAVVKLDRLTRSVRDLGALIEGYFNNGKLALLSVGEQIDTATAGGRFMLNVLGSVAQWERETIGERTKAALRHKRISGQAYGSVPFGFDRVGDRLIPNAKELATVEGIKRARALGGSLGSIAASLNAEGQRGKNGGRFHGCTVAKILRNHPVAAVS